ncbi:hypothetical protein NKG94_27615 [Micromonospora sp. M12]
MLAMVAGLAGFFIGAAGDQADPPTPTASASLAPYDAAQLSINEPKFAGDLAPLAKPWLSRIGGCVSYNGPGAPNCRPTRSSTCSVTTAARGCTLWSTG